MADENKQQEEGQPSAADDQKQGEGQQQQQQQQAAAGDGDVKDSHGQPGINKERHDKEVAELQAKIDALEKNAAEAAEQKAKRDEYEKEVADLKAELADSKLTHSLEMAGCIDLKAAKARLEDYGGSVSKLKEACPYLFGKEKETGSTGKKPEGGQGSALDEKLDKAFGLKK